MSLSTLDNGRFYGGVLQERRVGALTLAETRYGAGFVVPPHDHRQPFFCLGLRGTFTERMAGRSWMARPTTVFYHPAGAEHAEEFGGAGGRLFNVQLGEVWLSRLAAFDLTPPERQVRGTGGRSAWLATAILREFREDETAADLSVDGLALALLAHVIRVAEPRVRGSRPGWLGRVEELMHDRLTEPTDIAGLAAAVDIHPVHLARVFRRHHGCSPGVCVRRLRLRHACARLAESDDPIAAVALASGYADQSHLSRHVKRALGVTPAEYRRLVR